MHAIATTADTATELAGWLRLQHLPGVGPVAARALLARFGLPPKIFAAPFEALREVVPASVARAIVQPPKPVANSQLALTLQWLQHPGNAVLTLADAAYPPRRNACAARKACASASAGPFCRVSA